MHSRADSQAGSAAESPSRPAPFRQSRYGGNVSDRRIGRDLPLGSAAGSNQLNGLCLKFFREMSRLHHGGLPASMGTLHFSGASLARLIQIFVSNWGVPSGRPVQTDVCDLR